MHPQLTLFGFTLPLYGVAIAIGVVVAYNVAAFVGKRSNIGADTATTIYLAAIFGAFGGAKALAFIVEGKADLRGGGVFLGGYIGVLLVIVTVASLKKVSRLEALDVMIPVGAVGHFFGRLGCLLAGCCFGKPSASALAVPFVKGSVAYQTLSVMDSHLIDGEHTVPLLPTQLIEALFQLGLGAFFLFLLMRRVKTGTAFFLHAVLYACFRFAIEYIRFDPERGYVIDGVLSTSQFISLFVFALGVGGLIYVYRPNRKALA